MTDAIIERRKSALTAVRPVLYESFTQIGSIQNKTAATIINKIPRNLYIVKVSLIVIGDTLLSLSLVIREHIFLRVP